MKLTKKSSFLKQGKKYLSSLFWLIPCAGGICLRERQGRREILCIIHKDGSLMLPKGHVKKGETLPDAALREFREETGMVGSVLREKIGVLRDRKRGKKITFFAIEHIEKGPLEKHDEETVWVDIPHALGIMRHVSEQHFLEKYFSVK